MRTFTLVALSLLSACSPYGAGSGSTPDSSSGVVPAQVFLLDGHFRGEVHDAPDGTRHEAFDHYVSSSDEPVFLEGQKIDFVIVSNPLGQEYDVVNGILDIWCRMPDCAERSTILDASVWATD